MLIRNNTYTYAHFLLIFLCSICITTAHAEEPTTETKVEQEEAEETTAVEYQGDALEIGFNVSYLQDVLGVISTEQVKFTLSDANSSALIEEPDSSDAMYVVMPMRL